MKNDTGVYILISPTEKEGRSEEYRVAYLDSDNNISWEIDNAASAEMLSPAKTRPLFDKSTVHTDRQGALANAYRLGAEVAMTQPPVFYVYLDTSYAKWRTGNHGKESKS